MTKLRRVLAEASAEPAPLVRRRRRPLRLGLAALVVSGLPNGVAGQEPAAPLPQQLCLTNACSEALKDLSKPQSVREAVAAGDSVKVWELGGAPREVIAALDENYTQNHARRAAINSPGSAEQLAFGRSQLDRFMDPAQGVFSFAPPPGPGPLKPDGTINPVPFIMTRTTPSGCFEEIHVFGDGNYAYGNEVRGGVCPPQRVR